MDEDAFADKREQMVTLQLQARGIRDPRVLAALRAVPRHQFVSEELRERAYEDVALPLGVAGATISQPVVVAWMLEALAARATDRALEIGAGSGYAAAVLARLAREVFALERDPKLARLARDRLAALGVDNAVVEAGDGSAGWPAHAPYDVVLVSAAAPAVPQALLAQLAPGGRLVLPVGAPGGLQTLVRIERGRDGRIETRELGAVQFVPLVAG
jgi:protein-L-isoaspartate(D-aspartate) O-methyltransferase